MGDAVEIGRANVIEWTRGALRVELNNHALGLVLRERRT
jgi:hypothetical protein